MSKRGTPDSSPMAAKSKTTDEEMDYLFRGIHFTTGGAARHVGPPESPRAKPVTIDHPGVVLDARWAKIPDLTSLPKEVIKDCGHVASWFLKAMAKSGMAKSNAVNPEERQRVAALMEAVHAIHKFIGVSDEGEISASIKAASSMSQNPDLLGMDL